MKLCKNCKHCWDLHNVCQKHNTYKTDPVSGERLYVGGEHHCQKARANEELCGQDAKYYESYPKILKNLKTGFLLSLLVFPIILLGLWATPPSTYMEVIGEQLVVIVVFSLAAGCNGGWFEL
jgi:hypothetical protein